MQTYILFTKLSTDLSYELKNRKRQGRAWMEQVKAKCPEVKFLAHYAILGEYDFIDIYEAPDPETAAKVSIISQEHGAQAIDIEHDNRGHGISKFTLTDEGKKIFPEIAKRDTLFVMYYEGPVFIKKENDTISYETLAIMESDVHEEGNAPKNMTNNKPFFITNSYGKGRIFSSIAHPEATPGMMWMIPRMVRWTLNIPIKEYKSEVVNPDIFNREILMSISDLKQESAYYQTFLYGSAEEKIVAMDWLQSKHSWAAKRWVQGLLFDADASVRVRAAKYIADTHYIHYLPDLRAAYNSEKETQTKQQLKEQLDKLENIRDGF
jgi:uncharacterized protein with GYD domain